MSEGILLNLKSLYRLLNGNLRLTDETTGYRWTEGRSLISFWQLILLPALPSDLPDDILQVSGKRSRILSDLINRSGYGGSRSSLYRAFNDGMDSQRFFRLMGSWKGLLSTNEAQMHSLANQLGAYQDRFLSEDPIPGETVRLHLEQLRAAMLDAPDAENRRLRLIYWLSWLTVYAILGEGMNDGKPVRLSCQPALSFDVLFRRATYVNYGKVMAEVLSSQDCALCRHPLPESKFIDLAGRVDTLRNQLALHRRVLVTALDGMGKTELVRQLLRRLENDAVYARVAYIQYRNSWAESLGRAFPQVRSLRDQDALDQIREMLERQGIGRTLLLVDDAVFENEAPPSFLATVGCDVIVTSRQTSLDGFEAYTVPPLNAEETRKLLEAVCDRPFSDDELEYSQLAKETGGHPLALTLLAQVCDMQAWSCARLREEIRQTGLGGLSIVRYGQSTNILARLEEALGIPGLPPSIRQALSLLSAFGPGSWSPRAVEPLCMDICPDGDSLAQRLYSLWQAGWVRREENRYSVPPILRSVLTAKPSSLNSWPALAERLGMMLEKDIPQWSLPPDLQPGLYAAAQFASDPLLTGLVPALKAAELQYRLPGLDSRLPLNRPGVKKDEQILDLLLQLIDAFMNQKPEQQATLISTILDEANRLGAWTPALVIGLTEMANTIYDIDQLAVYLRLLEDVGQKCPRSPFLVKAKYVQASLHLMATRDFSAANACLTAGNTLMDTHWPDHLGLKIHREVVTGLLAYQSDNLEPALAHFEAALSMLADLPVPDEAMASNLYGYLGEAYLKRGDPGKAEEFYLKQFPNPEILELPNNLGALAALQDLAGFYLVTGQAEKAMTVSDKVIRNIRRFPNMNPVDQAGVWFVRARIYLLLGRVNNALDNLKRADALVRDLLPEDDPYRVRIRETIASIQS